MHILFLEKGSYFPKMLRYSYLEFTSLYVKFDEKGTSCLYTYYELDRKSGEILATSLVHLTMIDLRNGLLEEFDGEIEITI
jgi:hypothetical protein